MKSKPIFAILFSLVCLVFNLLGITPRKAKAAPAILYVCSSGCTYTTVQAAVNAANTGDEIQIATGTYTGVTSTDGVVQMVYITKSLTLRGGYKADFSTWDPQVYPTTLNAGSAGRVIYASGAITLKLYGLTLTNGNATGLGGDIYYGDDAGGALYVTGAELEMENCTVENSVASTSARLGHAGANGGGAYIANSQATISGDLFQNNITATVGGDYLGVGGGLAIYNSSSTIEDSTITANIAATTSIGEGGGIRLLGGTTVMNDNQITFNIASQAEESNTYGEGGGIFAAGSLSLSGNTISDNNAGYSNGRGGGMYLIGNDTYNLHDNQFLRNRGSAAASEHQSGYGGGVYLSNGKSVTLTDNLFQDNVAGERGGGIYIDDSTVTITGNTVQGNFASVKGHGMGGGMYLVDSPSSLSDNQFVANVAMDENIGGAGISGGGGGIYLETSNATLTDNRFEDNRAVIADESGDGYGGGVYITGGEPALIHNQIVENLATLAISSLGNTGWGGGVYIENSHTMLTQNLVDNNQASQYGDGYGGGVYTKGRHGSAPVLDSNVIVRNTASIHSSVVDGYGGGVAIYRGGETVPVILRNNVIAANDADDYGSGVWVGGFYETQSIGVQIYHNTIADNGGGNAAVMVAYTTTLEMINNIISGHNLGVFAISGGTATLSNTLWYGNGTSTGGPGTITHNNDVSGDPHFGDTANQNYHIGANSAALDVAQTTAIALDMDSQTRPNPNTHLPDIGADEFYCTAPTSITLSGPLNTRTGQAASLTAQIIPATTTLPLTFTWAATGQTDVVRQGGLSDTASFAWMAAGEKDITVSAQNACGAAVSTSFTLTVTEGYAIFVPIVRR